MPTLRDDIGTALDEVRRVGPETAALQARVVARVNDEIGRTQSNRGWPLAVAAGVLAALAVLGLVVGTHALRPTPAHRQQAPVFPPTSYSGQFAAYDVAERALVVLTLDSHGQASTWLWNGKSWSRAVGTQPVLGQGGQMAYDAARRELVLFSSSGGAGTWVWNGNWREASSGITPGPTAESGFMADDPLLRKVVYYDQNAGGWTWDGGKWERLSGVLDLVPSGLAFDGTRLILFGQDLSGEGTQTWAWSGSAWAEITQTAPPPPGAYAMGTGLGGRGLILYGGGEPPFPPDDTWLWSPDTMTWSLARPAHAPGPRLANIVYAPDEHHVLLYGGYELNDLWTWTGSDWQRVSGGTQPVPTAPGKTMSAGALTAYLASHSAGVSPLLAPSWLPASLDQGWISTESPKGGAAIVDFGYYDADRQMSIRVSVEVPGNSNLGAANRNISFRGTTALYQFFAGPPVRPLSLWWTEPGQWAGSQLKTPGIPYAITGHGLSEADFRRAANSLVAVAAQAPALHLDSIQMSSGGHGWAVDSQDQPSQMLLVTADSGRTWRSVGPTGFSNLLVADGAAAWIIAGQQFSTAAFAVMHTSDWGAHWTRSNGSLVAAPIQGRSLLSFVGGHGWLLIPGEPASEFSQQGAWVYASNDYGASWSLLSQITVNSALAQCGKVSIAFRDATTGWITGPCNGAPGFLVTHDGGRTWAKGTLPAPPGGWQAVCSFGPCGLTAPSFWSSTSGFMALNQLGGASPAYLYRTADGATTWQISALPSNATIQLLDASNGVAGGAGAFFETRNGGKSWSAIPSPLTPEIVSLSCTSLQQCWAVDTNGELWQTADGGASWTPVAARVS